MPISNPKEEIDIRILRLVGLKDVFDLDYDTYFTLLREAAVKGNMPKSSIPIEEVELLTNEIKRIKNKKNDGRFSVKPKKKIGPSSFNVGSTKKLIASSKSSKGGAIVLSKEISKSPVSKGLENSISQIASSISSIAETLKTQKKISDDASAYDRKKAEKEKRGLAESKLEKVFKGIVNTAQKIIAPVKSLLSRIFEFIGTVILGRIVFKIIEWFGDKKNGNKVKTIIRFFKDNWPKLLSLYLVFGTSFGKFARGLISLVVKGTAGLVRATAGLAAKVIGGKLGGRLGRVSKFLGGKKGKLAVAGVEAVATIGGTLALSKGLENFGGIGGEEPKPQKFSGGGLAIPRFGGGGFNFKGMMSGAMFGPLGMLLGAGLGSGIFSGLVKGPGGSKEDKIPAMLSNGEFVMSAGAVQKYGVDTLEAMNSAGGGDNRPKIMGGATYAAGGGYMGDYMKDQVKMRPAGVYELSGNSRVIQNLLGVNKEEAARLVSRSGQVPDIESLIGKSEFVRLQEGHINKFSEGADDKTFKSLRRIYQQHFGVGPEFEKMMSNRVDAKMLDRSTTPKPTSAPRPKSKVIRIDPSRMLPSAGQSSANAMRAAAKAAQNVRAPIPASRAIVPYAGGGLARTGVTGGLSAPQIQQIRTNMNVPGGKGGRGGIAGTILTSLAEIFKPQIQSFVGEMYDKMGIGLGNLSDAELKKQLDEQTKRVKKLQSGPMGSFVGGGIETDQLQFLQEEANKRRLGRLKGGAIKGGYGLKQQSFKDMPKTQIMTDDKGRPFLGYKAMRGGKPVYVRGPQPGQGTSNPFEMLGRAINPGAYKDIDDSNARRKYNQASAGNIASLKARGASQATIARTKAQLAKTKPIARVIKPRPKPYVPAGGGMGGGRGSKASKPSGTKTPNFSATTNGMRSKMETLGMMR